MRLDGETTVVSISTMEKPLSIVIGEEGSHKSQS